MLHRRPLCLLASYHKTFPVRRACVSGTRELAKRDHPNGCFQRLPREILLPTEANMLSSSAKLSSLGWLGMLWYVKLQGKRDFLETKHKRAACQTLDCFRKLVLGYGLWVGYERKHFEIKRPNKSTFSFIEKFSMLSHWVKLEFFVCAPNWEDSNRCHQLSNWEMFSSNANIVCSVLVAINWTN